MLRGWKSASCSGFPAFPGLADGKAAALAGILLASKNALTLWNKLLRPILFMRSPTWVNRSSELTPQHEFFYLVYFALSKWHKAPVSVP